MILSILCNKKLCKASIRMHEKTKKHISNKVGHPPIENIPLDQDPTEENPNEKDISEVSIPTTPDIIELSQGEMFNDNEGNPFHVEVVGIRGSRKNTCFKANYSNSISSIYGNNDPQWVSKRIYKETKKSNTLFSKNIIVNLLCIYHIRQLLYLQVVVVLGLLSVL